MGTEVFVRMVVDAVEVSEDGSATGGVDVSVMAALETMSGV